MTKAKLKEIIEVSWLLLSTGFWMMLATYRGLRIRYLSWRKSRMETDCDHFKATLEEKNK